MRTAISLFSGGGIADIGLLNAGFEILASVEKEDWIAKNARQNLGDHVITASVGDVNFKPYKGADLVFLSPPCQGDSVARSKSLPTHVDYSVGRDAIRAIQEISPRWVLLENVPGYRNNPAYHELRNNLFSNGYWINEDVIDFANYGVPQHRKRLITRAVKCGFVAPLPLTEPWLNWWDAIADLVNDCPITELANWQKKQVIKKELSLPFLLGKAGNKKGLSDWDSPSSTVTSNHDNFCLLIPRAGCREFKLVESDRPAPTLRALGHDRHWRQFDLFDGFEIRKLIPRGEARLQTVPDWYQLPQASWKAKKIIGNGAPSLGIEKIARCF